MALLRLYWRELLRLLVLALPLVILALLGLLWLVERGLLLPAVAAGALLGFMLLAPTWIWRRATHVPEDAGARADAPWSPAEEAAWDKVRTLAGEAQSKPPETTDEMTRLARRVVECVANELHGNSKNPWANFTFPEILLALETTAHNLRHSALARVPGAEAITLAHLLAIHEAYRTWKPAAEVLWNVYRVARLLANPVQAAIQEASQKAQGSAAAATRDFLGGVLARSLVEELGRSTINLYGGRYRLSAGEALRVLSEGTREPDAPVTVRILLAGQVNAGKSSLANALLGAVQAPVSEVPTPGDTREFRTAPDSPIDLVILDSPGLTATGRELDTLMGQLDTADLILWVAQATKPGRQVDTTALDEIRRHFQANPARRPPPMVLAMTHSDKLSPAREWSPPYDLDHPATAKAVAMADALDHVGVTLGFDREPRVPVALPPGEEPYNLDALWAAIGASLKDAQLTALDRTLKQRGGFSLARTFAQCREGGRFLLGEIWTSRDSGSRQ